jgi:hypothetical protein
MQRYQFSIFVFLGLVTSLSEANDSGKLPRGIPSAKEAVPVATVMPTPSPMTSPPAAQPESLPTPKPTALTPASASPSTKTSAPSAFGSDEECQVNFANQVNPRLFIDGETLYYLSRESGSQDQYKFRLNKISLKNSTTDTKITAQVDKILAFNGPRHVVLFVHDIPARGFSIFTVGDLSHGCAQGVGAGVTIPIRRGKSKSATPVNSVPEGRYTWFDSTLGRLFLDVQKFLVRGIDPVMAQQRVIYQVEKDSLPLSWDHRNKVMVTWRGGEERKLIKTGSTRTLKISELPVRLGEKIIQDQNRFGLMKINAAQNSVGIAQIKGWSDFVKTRIYALKLPQGVFADQASLKMDFPSGLVSVFQTSSKAKATVGAWTKAFVFKLGLGMVSVLDFDVETMVAAAGHTIGRRKLAVFVLEDRKSGIHRDLRVFDIEKNQWTSIAL